MSVPTVAPTEGADISATPTRHRVLGTAPRVPRALAVGFAAALIAAACGPEQPDEPVPGNELEPPEEPVDEEPPEEDPFEAPEEAPPEEEDPVDGAAPLDGEETTEASDDGEVGVVAVTDVRVGTHPGFDRLVFEIEGDGVAGWDLRYVDEATSQGRGEPIEVEGEAVLAVSLHNVTLPPELPEEIDRWDADRVEGPVDGVIHEVVHDTIFEGVQGFFVGLDSERAFIIDRFEDPQRVVIDIPHDG
jgi:hypothetical protein